MDQKKGLPMTTIRTEDTPVSVEVQTLPCEHLFRHDGVLFLVCHRGDDGIEALGLHRGNIVRFLYDTMVTPIGGFYGCDEIHASCRVGNDD